MKKIEFDRKTCSSSICLDNYIQKTKKQYADTRTSREAMSRLRTGLGDVQNIMLTNIQDVMSRGETLVGKRICFFSSLVQ